MKGGSMKLYLCGDSTAACFDPKETPKVGWGQILPSLLPGVDIQNHSIAGRSTRTFLAEGRLERFRDELAPGDLMLIQFGHNDAGSKPERHTEPFRDFTDNLNVFIDTALARGATPVLLTPTCVRCFKDGQLQPVMEDYREAIRALAEKRAVPLIDMYDEGFRRIAAMGEEASRALYMNLEKGEDPRCPDGLTDNTHTRRAGAELYAHIAADGLRRLLKPLHTLD